MKLLAAKAKDYAAQTPVVLIGDCNYSPDSEPYALLAASMRDSCREDPSNTDDRYVTFHDFTGVRTIDGHSEQGRIDYIWLKGNIRVARSWIVFDRPGSDPGVYPSDLWPIACDLALGHR